MVRCEKTYGLLQSRSGDRRQSVAEHHRLLLKQMRKREEGEGMRAERSRRITRINFRPGLRRAAANNLPRLSVYNYYNYYCSHNSSPDVVQLNPPPLPTKSFNGCCPCYFLSGRSCTLQCPCTSLISSEARCSVSWLCDHQRKLSKTSPEISYAMLNHFDSDDSS